MILVRAPAQAAATATIGMSLSAGAMAGEVNIGFTGPLSGGAALYGENTLSGLRMAVAEINAAGGFDLNGEKLSPIHIRRCRPRGQCLHLVTP